ncbi:hypothetical protein BDB01DRAFT_780995 [Pilobolus umbonatus]|nr:hypothetical protein BDB01DRAFT_780995 [Pilobolus umbonatus]
MVCSVIHLLLTILFAPNCSHESHGSELVMDTQVMTAFNASNYLNTHEPWEVNVSRFFQSSYTLTRVQNKNISSHCRMNCHLRDTLSETSFSFQNRYNPIITVSSIF